MWIICVRILFVRLKLIVSSIKKLNNISDFTDSIYHVKEPATEDHWLSEVEKYFGIVLLASNTTSLKSINGENKLHFI